MLGVLQAVESCDRCGAPICPSCGDEGTWCDGCDAFHCEGCGRYVDPVRTAD
jgi:hypothetical protein